MRGLREFARPLPLAAAALLAVNDHVLKGAGLLPTWLTGKLSDVAGLFFFPILLFALTSLVLPPQSRIPRAIALSLATGAAFAALKLVPRLNASVASVWEVVMDPTDLLVLPVLALSVVYLREPPLSRVAERSGSDLVRAAGVVLAGLASMATSAPRNVRNYPAWQVVGTKAMVSDCVEVTPVVVKSGKEGIGVVVAVRGLAACASHLVASRVLIEGASFPGVFADNQVDASSRTVRSYLAFSFDNNVLWNKGQNDGSLELELETGAGLVRLAFHLHEIWESAHRRVDYGGAPMPPPPPPVGQDAGQ